MKMKKMFDEKETRLREDVTKYQQQNKYEFHFEKKIKKIEFKCNFAFNLSSAGVSLFLDLFRLFLLEGRVLHKGAWVATLLGVQVYKKVKFLCTV